MDFNTTYNLTFDFAKKTSCFFNNTVDTDCINRQFCSQFDKYFINMGITIIICYFIISWLLWWFLNHGWKMLDETLLKDYSGKIWIFNIKLPLNFNEYETRAYWYIFVQDKIIKFMLGYIVVAVWLNIK